MKKKQHYDVEESSGNIFADLGLANPEEALAKAQLAIEISKIIKKRKLTQVRVAKILKIAQPKVSLLLRGYLKSFSLERLLRFLNALGQDIRITITPSSHHGHGSTMIGDSRSTARIAALGR
ncbi:MAG TPA: helix-turn-helix transcriptional regulator [Rhabdochlamydiaceae bacterium]|nr:helix-turn-helix transcriptional regulator [Rhabdochlamydiaceae bacterium]